MGSKNYTVTRAFTDGKGRQWQPNQPFNGDEATVQAQLKEGNITEEAPLTKEQKEAKEAKEAQR